MALDVACRRPRARPRVHRHGRRARGSASGSCSTRRPCSRGSAPAAWPSSSPARTTSRPTHRAGPGHIVKARYTPMQQMLLAVDEQDSPHHAELADADDLAGMPVVVADLHSALPAVLAGIRRVRPDARVAYVMTDGGALPAAFSRAVAGLADAGWLAATLTVGQAFGGDHEAVTTHTGLLAARHVVGADVAVVAQGPGNVGTGHPLGLLRGGLRRRPARRRRARRPVGGVAARLGGRPARAAPRHQPPQPHGLRPRAAHAGGRAGHDAAGRRARRPRARPAGRARRHRPGRPSPSSRCPPTGCSRRWHAHRWR